MYNKIWKIIKKEIENNIDAFYSRERLKDEFYIIIIYIKYLCDNNIDGFSYELVKNENYQEIIEYLSKKCSYQLLNEQINIEKILNLIKDKHINELVEDLFNNNDKIGINLIDKDKKKLCLIYCYDFSSYDRYGNTTYINYMYYINMNVFILLDEILGIHNEYYYHEKYKLKKDINYIYISDKLNIKRINDNWGAKNLASTIMYYLGINKEIMLKTEYRKISYINWPYFIDKIDKIILNSKYEKNESFLIFKNNKEDDILSLILYDEDKIKELESLKIIIKDNIENEDNLIKISTKDIVDNNYRIGFKLYSKNRDKKINKTINTLVDDNKKIMKKLNEVDYTIEIEMNKLMNK